MFSLVSSSAVRADDEESEPTAPPSSSSTEPPAPTEPPVTPEPTEPPVVDSTTPETPETTVGEPPESTSPDGSATSVPDSSAPDSSAPSSSEAPAAPRLELPETLPHPDEWDGVLELKDLAPFDGEDFVTLTVGQQFTVEADGFAPDTPVLLGIFSDPVELADGTTDGSGQVELAAVLPAGLVGEHTLALLGTGADGGERFVATGVMISPPIMLFGAGDLAHGVVYADANKDNARTSAVIGEDDRGLAGVTVNALDAAGNVVASTVTGPDGSWNILEADVVGGPAVAIEIVTAGANGNVYATHPATSGDNDFARDGGPNRAVAPLPDPAVDVELNALVYPTWALDAQLANDPDGVGGKSILTGAPVFDADDSEPGHDSGTSNTRVRSADIVTFNWSLTASTEDGSLGNSFESAVFEQTIVLNGGAIANFAGIPAICDTGSNIVAHPSGITIDAKVDPPAGTTSVTLSCVLGEMGVAPAPSAYLLGTQVQPSSKSPNGSSFGTEARFYAVDDNGAATAQPDQGPEVPPIEITAAPRYDLSKSGGNIALGSIVVDGETIHGRFIYYSIKVSTDRKVGVEAFQQPVEIEEQLWAVRTVPGPNGEPVGSVVDDLKWYIQPGGCVPAPTGPSQGLNQNENVGGRIGLAGTTVANSVRDSGTCTVSRNGDPDTGNYTLTLDGIDTSGLTYPTQTVGGQSLAAGPYYVASYRLQVFVPTSEVDRLEGAPFDGVGEISVFNRVGDFDPDGISGASNFGSGVEPGYCAAGSNTDEATNCDPMEGGTRSNNVTGPVTYRIAAGNFGKYFYDANTAWSNANIAALPGSGTGHDGAGQVQPGQAFTSRVILNNSGSLDWTSTEFCDVFDSTVLRLVPLQRDAGGWDAGRHAAVIQTGVSAADNQADQANWIFRYGTVDLSGDNANTGVFHTATNRYEGIWTNQQAATNGANTACGRDIGWSDTPSDSTNVVWARSVEGKVVTAGAVLHLHTTFEQRDTYSGGPNDGAVIPNGTVAANFGAVKTSGYHPNWSPAGYVPGAGDTGGPQSGENGSVQGDRWTVARAMMSLQKRTIAATVGGEAASGVADFGQTGAAVAGRPVVWEIVATLTAASDDPAPVGNVVITDTLPNYVVYDEAGTQELATAGGFPMPASVTLNGDGTTTLVWNLGTRTPNAESPNQPGNNNGGLPLLHIATYTDSMAPPNTTAVNRAVITADNMTPLAVHTDDHTIVIQQSGQVQLKKSVDRPLDLQDDDQQWLLEVRNFSETLQIQPPTIYEVLPYNGDATNAANVQRTPPSAYVGTNLLDAAPVATDWNGGPRPGTFWYTTVPAAAVPQQQADDTDPSIWSTAFTPNATGFKFVADTNLTTTANPAQSGIKITFQTNQSGNAPGDIYTNRFTAISQTLNSGNQLLTSNTVSVRVIGFSLGDLLWFDLDGDGVYTAGVDRPAPAGVTVEVRSAADGSVVATTTTLSDAVAGQQGRWIVNDLATGDYYVTIPAAMFAPGGLLAGAVPAPGAEADPNTDVNEGGDHHAIADGAGARSAGLISLTAQVDDPTLPGHEPTGDNVAGLITSPLTTDDYTNLTVDLAFVPGVEFTIVKRLDGSAAEHATGPFVVEVSCVFDGAVVRGYPQTVTFTAAGGVQTLAAPLGSLCTATETDNGGATSVTITPENGIVLDSEDGEFEIEVTNVFAAVSVGDFVWHDVDRDGIQDVGEPGLAGVVLTLTGPDGWDGKDIFGNDVLPFTTLADGAYLFELLPVLADGESYTVTVTTPPPGYIATLEGQGSPTEDSSTGFAVSGPLTRDGDEDMSLDFGFVWPMVSAGDFVWHDVNRDGIQDDPADEPGLPGVELTLSGPAGWDGNDVYGNPVGTRTTLADGAYLFADLPGLAPGQSYTVTVTTPPAGYIPTLEGQGGDPALDSSTGTAASGDLVADGASDLTLDFGFVWPMVSVGDFVWHDVDRDGIQGDPADEPGLPGVELTLSGPAGWDGNDVYGNPVLPVFTGPDGSYVFEHLPALLGDGEFYTVTVTGPPAGFIPTLEGQGSPATDSSTGFAESGALTTDGASDLTLDFGFVWPMVSVGDFVWHDVDRDGIQGDPADEPGLEGVELTLSGPAGWDGNDVYGNPVAPVLTGPDGSYVFENLPALLGDGEFYTVTVSTPPAGYIPTLEGEGGDPALDSSTGFAVSAALTTDGASDLTLDFGFVWPMVSVGDLVWNDVDRDGIQGAGEPGLEGVELTLSGPEGWDGNDVFGDPVLPVLTGPDGLYLFEGLPALLGDGEFYTVTVTGPPAGFVPAPAGVGDDRAVDSSIGSADSGPLVVDGASDLTLDFGFMLAAVSVGDFVWHDLDRDGIQDAGEPGLAGVVLTLTGPGGWDGNDVTGTPITPVTTGADGAYLFELLPVLADGEVYTVTVTTPPAGYIATLAEQGGDRAVDSSTGSAASATLTDHDDADLTLDFGFVWPKVAVGDYVWHDVNGNGIQDPGEPGIAGVELTLTGPDGGPVVDVFGNPVAPVATDSNGAYLFENLPALPAGAHYTVTVTSPPAGYVPTIAGAGTPESDSSTGSAESADLVDDGDSDMTLDFGFVIPPTAATTTLPGTLPATGSDSIPTIWIAAVALLAGLALVVITRRRLNGTVPQ